MTKVAGVFAACFVLAGSGCGGSNEPEPTEAESTDCAERTPPDPTNAPTGDEVVPADPDELFEYLSEGRYTDLEAESGLHGPTNGSPHGPVRVFFNPLLADSFEDENDNHPAGAAAIKELHDSSDELFGWAVAIKTEETACGDAWYWYEIFDLEEGSDPVVSEQGAATCVSCHMDGVDYIRTSYPFEN
jgi:hypothetical protein